MGVMPRIRRAVTPPRASVTHADHPIRVIVRLEWQPTGEVTEVPATAIAWTRDVVQIVWQWDVDGTQHTDWVSADRVRRAGSTRSTA